MITYIRDTHLSIGCVLLVLALLAVGSTQPAHAQTYTEIHSFSGPDGIMPDAGVTMDRAGNLYGTTYSGGTTDRGTVFKLVHRNGGWILNPLYSFQGGNDGAFPVARVVFGPDGALYGTTSGGGDQACHDEYGNPGCGTVFKLTPPATVCKTSLCPWTETVLYRFTGGNNGAFPSYGDLVFDPAGNVYGTTQGDEGGNTAVVFMLSPSSGGWTESTVYSFAGDFVASGVIFDAAGNLYGATAFGDSGFGTVYELSPSASGWTKTALYSFQGINNPYDPLGTPIFDAAGNLYGTTFESGGSVYELQPSDGLWAFSTLYSFNAYEGSFAAPSLDAAGNVYATSTLGGGAGNVIKLTKSGSGWTETDLVDFAGTSGYLPVGNVVVDANGNVFGTTSLGGTYVGGTCASGCGVVFEITPN